MIVDCPKCRLDLAPAPFFVQRALNGAGYEGTPLAATREAIQLTDQSVVKANVQTHGLKLAHRLGHYLPLAISAASALARRAEVMKRAADFIDLARAEAGEVGAPPQIAPRGS